MSVGKHHVIPFYQKYPKISQLYIYLYTSIISHCIPPLGSPALRPKTPGYSARYAMPHWNMEGTRWRMGRVHAGWGERQGFWSFFGGFEGCKKWRRNNDQRNVQKFVLAVEMVNMAKFWESCCQIDVSPHFCLAMCWKIGCFRPNKMVGLGWMVQRRTET